MKQHTELENAIQRRNEAYYSLCDKLITLSTGAIALSVTFNQTLIPKSPHCLWLLRISWILFVATIFAGFAVHWGNAWIWNKRVNEILDGKSSDGRLPRRFSVYRWLMFTAFALAILSFTGFALVNV